MRNLKPMTLKEQIAHARKYAVAVLQSVQLAEDATRAGKDDEAYDHIITALEDADQIIRLEHVSLKK